MKKIGFVFGCLTALLGMLLMAGTMLLGELVPKLGYMAFQFAAAGSYTPSDYQMDLMRVYLFSLLMMLVGIVAAVAFYRAYGRRPDAARRSNVSNMRLY